MRSYRQLDWLSSGAGAVAGLDPILTPFTALDVLILAIAGPFMTKETKTIYNALNQIYKWSKELKKKVIEVPKSEPTNSI